MTPSRVSWDVAPGGDTALAWIDLDADTGNDTSDNTVADDRACLSDDELQRADRFVFARDRARHLAAHAVLRQILAERTGRLPQDLRFQLGAFGKPALLGLPTCHFNLSHSQGVGLIGLSHETELGVDVEVWRAVPDALAIARTVFTPTERAALAATDATRRDACFLHCWTRKEACMKAVGLGFELAPDSFEVGIDAEPREVMVHLEGQLRALRLHTVVRGTLAIASVALRA